MNNECPDCRGLGVIHIPADTYRGDPERWEICVTCCEAAMTEDEERV